MISHVESKKIIQMNLFTKQKQTHRHRKQTYCYQRGKGGGGINQEFGINRYTLLYIKQINNKDVLYNTGNYIQYLVISCNNYIQYLVILESENICMHVCIYIQSYLYNWITFVYLKLTQYCKSTVLQFEKVNTFFIQDNFRVMKEWLAQCLSLTRQLGKGLLEVETFEQKPESYASSQKTTVLCVLHKLVLSICSL